MRTILFAGHRMDAGNRPAPRFPSDMEALAGKAIRDAVASIAADRVPVRGIAGGASGGDILFHEACGHLHIPTRLCLPMKEEAFIAESVAPAGFAWVQRFKALAARVPPVFLRDWLNVHETTDTDAHTVWEQNNQWLLDEGLIGGPDNLTVLVLWDGKVGDGPGGTGALVRAATDAGAHVIVIDAAVLQSDAAREGE